jgi:hypothetical protein
MIKIRKDELMHFVNIANATFGAFQFEIDDGSNITLLCLQYFKSKLAVSKNY